MERTSRENTRQPAHFNSESESGGASMMPPEFGVTAEPAQLHAAPVQRQDDGSGGGGDDDGGGGGWWSRVVNWVKSWFGGGNDGNTGGGNTPAPGTDTPTPGTDTPTPTPEVTTPTNDGPTQDTDTPQATTTVDVEGTVGDGGANRPADVLAVQIRLNELGFLSDANLAAERPEQDATEAIATGSLTQTIVAIAQFSDNALGRPLMVIRPGQITETLINNDPDHAMGSVAVGGTVGEGGTNNAADVRVVQARLNTLGHLSDANLTAEQVAEDATGTIADNAIPQTIAAIHDFNLNVTGTSLSIIRADSLEQATLNSPPRFEVSHFSLSGSVGTGGDNNREDVIAVQARLESLGYLATGTRTAETPDTETTPQTDPIPDAELTGTIVAINSFQEAMGLTQDGNIGPGNESHRQLINPSLSREVDMNISASVGTGGTNTSADVRIVQDRLQEIGFLSTSDYLAERVDRAAAGNVADADIPQTLAALLEFQRRCTGNQDGRMDPGGRLESMLNNPTHGSLTDVNPEALNNEAGIDFGNSDAALQRIIDAIEAGEGGGLVGEAPAYLTNGAGTPASFGASQMIGGTAVSTLRNNADIAEEEYGLSREDLTEMNTMAGNTRGHYDDIYDLVPMGTSQADLATAIQDYKDTHGEDFNEETGLALEDIDRMFHTANVRRRINGGQDWTNDDLRTSAQACGISQRSVNHYVRRPTHMGENRQGFITRSVFAHEKGQELRNAMTDGNGPGLGRLLIRDNYNSASRVVPNTDPNRAEHIAAVTARIHNQGGTAANRYANITATMNDPYVVHFLGNWR